MGWGWVGGVDGLGWRLGLEDGGVVLDGKTSGERV